MNQRSVYLTLWGLMFLFAGATFLPLFPGPASPQLIVASQIVPAALFALVHGRQIYGARGILVFAAISIVVGNVVETIGVATGFPFGRYSFTDAMGPRLFLVPVLMGPAYLGMGYVSWTLGRLIHSDENQTLGGRRLLTVPLAAAFIMVAWDFAIDPTLSTLGHYWIWLDGGAYYGVPFQNFLGWYLTNYIIYQLFALYLWRRSPRLQPVALRHWLLTVVFYGVCALGNVLRIFSNAGSAVVADATGRQWKVSEINSASALAAIFMMGSLVVLALAKLSERERTPTSGNQELEKMGTGV